MKVVFTGYYGFDNFGDDLFPLACLSGMEKNKSLSVFILSPKIQGVDANFLVPEFLSGLYSRNSFTGSLVRFLFMLYAAFLCDFLILAGGSVISSSTSWRMRQLQYLIAKLKICRVGAVGVSVGPFDNQRSWDFYSKFIHSLCFLSVRDSESYRYANEMGRVDALSSVDIVGVLKPKFENIPVKHIANNVVSIGICNYESYIGSDLEKEKRRYNSILNSLISLNNNIDCSFKIISLNGNAVIGDDHLAMKLASDLELNGIKSVVCLYSDPIKTVEEIKSSTLFITTRLHGAIVAYLLGVRFSLIEYHNKCTDFLDLIKYPVHFRLEYDSGKVLFNESLELMMSKENQFEVRLSPNEYVCRANNSFLKFIENAHDE